MESLASSCRAFDPQTVTPKEFTFSLLAKEKEKKEKKEKKDPTDSKENSKTEKVRTDKTLPKRIALRDFSMEYSMRLSGLNTSQAEYYLEHFPHNFVTCMNSCRHVHGCLTVVRICQYTMRVTHDRLIFHSGPILLGPANGIYLHDVFPNTNPFQLVRC